MGKSTINHHFQRVTMVWSSATKWDLSRNLEIFRAAHGCEGGKLETFWHQNLSTPGKPQWTQIYPNTSTKPHYIPEYLHLTHPISLHSPDLHHLLVSNNFELRLEHGICLCSVDILWRGLGSGRAAVRRRPALQWATLVVAIAVRTGEGQLRRLLPWDCGTMCHGDRKKGHLQSGAPVDSKVGLSL